MNILLYLCLPLRSEQWHDVSCALTGFCSSRFSDGETNTKRSNGPIYEFTKEVGYLFQQWRYWPLRSRWASWRWLRRSRRSWGGGARRRRRPPAWSGGRRSPRSRPRRWRRWRPAPSTAGAAARRSSWGGCGPQAPEAWAEGTEPAIAKQSTTSSARLLGMSHQTVYFEQSIFMGTRVRRLPCIRFRL